MAVIYIIIYSLYGHIKALAEEIQKGIEASGTGSTAKIFQVPETLSPEIIAKMHGASFDLPIISPSELKNADGFLFGIPTRFGNMPAEMKAFFDSTGQEWVAGSLRDKFAGTFFATGTQHGGQETTAYTAITWFVHHAINYVPLGYTADELRDNTEIVGGGPWATSMNNNTNNNNNVITTNSTSNFVGPSTTSRGLITEENKSEKKKRSMKAWFCCGCI
ncbi:1336_t:CDS:2 [Ambispora leptoticha]|uniref:1336_t:CDS:1 n=1 Tax=Ambispora leptoticha TaxID=144679 RepID=A0A9N8YQ31_9GLOM|nr:1336_t:CDS:2 [Ambispora leptoticha]